MTDQQDPLQTAPAAEAQLQAEIDVLEQQIQALRAKQRTLRRLDADTRLPPHITPENVMSVDVLDVLRADREWEADHALNGLITALGGGLYPNGYVTEGVNQYALQVMYDQSLPYETQTGPARILKLLREVPGLDRDGWTPERQVTFPGEARVMNIFEHTCAADGVYSLRVQQDDTASLWRYSGRDRLLRTFGTVDAALRYIYEHHPYRQQDGEQDDDG